MAAVNLFLFACPRSGSSQLAHWLDTHPDIALSPIKEPNYFSHHEFPDQYVRETHLNDVDPDRYLMRADRRPTQFAVLRDRQQYDRLFPNAAPRWRMEASTTYLSCPNAPALIHEYAPDARIITLVRDPLARALSHYRLAVRTGRTAGPLGDELAAERAGITPLPARFLLRPSLYQDGLERVRSLFPSSQILHLNFETMIADPATSLARICTFLDIPPGAINLNATARNEGVAPRFVGLNRILYRSGAKTLLRRALPRSLKQRLLPFYFAANRPISITANEILALETALGSTVEAAA